jgi:DNA-binding Lrp family transcriptional regulator
MTVSAYVLIQTDVGKAAGVAKAVGAVKGVTIAETVTGPYDAIVRVEGDTMDEVAKTVVSRIQMVDGITRTLTCEVVHI